MEIKRKNYTHIPNYFIWNCKKGELSLMRGIKCDKLIEIITFINTKTDREDESNFSLNKLIRHCGLIPTKGVKGTINQFKNDLLKLVEVGLLEDIDDTIKDCKGEAFAIRHYDTLKFLCSACYAACHLPGVCAAADYQQHDA